MLNGEVALVTGASRGIGQAIALEMGRLGATVIGTATSSAGAARISAFLADAGSKGEGAVLEVRDAPQVEELISRIEEIRPGFQLARNFRRVVHESGGTIDLWYGIPVLRVEPKVGQRRIHIFEVRESS